MSKYELITVLVGMFLVAILFGSHIYQIGNCKTEAIKAGMKAADVKGICSP